MNVTKTPDEIKKGLRDGPEYHVHRGEAYLSYTKLINFRQKLSDALAYILQLETKNHQLLTKAQQLESTISQVSKALCGKENATAEEIIEAFSQVKRERDAAVESIRDSSHCCDFCKHNKWGCTSHAEPDGSCFEWRGAKEE